MQIKFSKNGFIEKLSVQGVNIINPWGVETGDSVSFFSLTDGGWKNQILHQECIRSEKESQLELRVQMQEGLWDLRVKEKIQDNSIVRSASLCCLEDTYLMDFVIRYRFKSKFFHTALINNQAINYKNSNIYYQYPVQKVSLNGNLTNVDITTLAAETCAKFKQVMYVRDYNDEWIVHSRLLPISADKKVLKLCIPCYNKAIPQQISDFLLRSEPIWRHFCYKTEKKNFKPYNLVYRLLKPSAYPLIKLCKGQTIKLATRFCRHSF